MFRVKLRKLGAGMIEHVLVNRRPISHDGLKAGACGNGVAIFGHGLQMQVERLYSHIARLIKRRPGSDAAGKIRKRNA